MITQAIVYERPPVYQRCVEVFGCKAITGSVIWSWGDRIYNPGKGAITPALRAHEATHGERQLAQGIEAWWERYLTDVPFRLEEEVLAHHAEWIAHKRRHGPTPRMLKDIAARLSGPLYGEILTPGQATHAVITGAIP